MPTRPHRPTAAFELSDGARRFALALAGPTGLQPDHAASLLRRRLLGDWYLRQNLAAWYRRTIITPAFADDERILEAALRDAASGRLRVVELDRAPPSAYAHTYERSEAPASGLEPQALEPLDPALDEPTVLDQRRVEYLAVGDFNFSTDRAVMLAGPSSEAELDGDFADGVALIAGLLAHLRRVGEDRRVLAAGHTDAVGTFAHNLELSEQRALSVKLACEGDAEGFADHAVAMARSPTGKRFCAGSIGALAGAATRGRSTTTMGPRPRRRVSGFGTASSSSLASPRARARSSRGLTGWRCSGSTSRTSPRDWA